MIFGFSSRLLFALYPLLARSSTVDESFVEAVMASVASIKPVLVLDPDQTSFSKWDGMLPTAIGSMDPAKVGRFLELDMHNSASRILLHCQICHNNRFSESHFQQILD